MNPRPSKRNAQAVSFRHAANDHQTGCSGWFGIIRDNAGYFFSAIKKFSSLPSPALLPAVLRIASRAL